ncbi:hypothetical protein ERO13_D13G000166v2 [Gossypium hirsutum]|nr:hypothetical protein ERO13_D13G000166v2 [Gossypium hirsutum]
MGMGNPKSGVPFFRESELSALRRMIVSLLSRRNWNLDHFWMLSFKACFQVIVSSRLMKMLHMPFGV